METQHDQFSAKKTWDLRNLSEAELIASGIFGWNRHRPVMIWTKKYTVTAFSKRLLICATPRRSGIRHNLLQGQLLAELALFVLFHFR